MIRTVRVGLGVLVALILAGILLLPPFLDWQKSLNSFPNSSWEPGAYRSEADIDAIGDALNRAATDRGTNENTGAQSQIEIYLLSAILATLIAIAIILIFRKNWNVAAKD